MSKEGTAKTEIPHEIIIKVEEKASSECQYGSQEWMLRVRLAYFGYGLASQSPAAGVWVTGDRPKRTGSYYAAMIHDNDGPEDSVTKDVADYDAVKKKWDVARGWTILRYLDESESPSGQEQGQAAEVARLQKLVKELIPLAKDGYKLHVSNACHQEFLNEDKELILRAETISNKSN